MSFNHPLTAIPGTQGATGPKGNQGPVGYSAYNSAPSTFSSSFFLPDGKLVTVTNGLITKIETSVPPVINKFWIDHLDNTWWTCSGTTYTPSFGWEDLLNNQTNDYFPTTTGSNANWNVNYRPSKIRLIFESANYGVSCSIYSSSTVVFTTANSPGDVLEIDLSAMTTDIFKMRISAAGGGDTVGIRSIQFWDFAPVGLCIKQYCVGTDLYGTFTTTNTNVFLDQLVQANSVSCGYVTAIGTNTLDLSTLLRSINTIGTVGYTSPNWIFTNASKPCLTKGSVGYLFEIRANGIVRLTLEALNLPTSLWQALFWTSIDASDTATMYAVNVSLMTITNVSGDIYTVDIPVDTIPGQFVMTFGLQYNTTPTTVTLSSIKY
jgi:hypothetical protein